MTAFVPFVGQQSKNAGSWVYPANVFYGFDPGMEREVEIHQRDLRPVLGEQADRLITRRSSSDEFHIRLKTNQHGDALAQHWIVIYREYTDFAIIHCPHVIWG